MELYIACYGLFDQGFQVRFELGVIRVEFVLLYFSSFSFSSPFLGKLEEAVASCLLHI